MGVKYVNGELRTELLKNLNVGESILLTPYQEGEFQKESAAIKVTAHRFNRTFEVKSVLVVVENELSQRFLRVTRRA